MLLECKDMVSQETSYIRENFLEEMMFEYRLLSQKWEQKNEKSIAGKGKESRNEKEHDIIHEFYMIFMPRREPNTY